MYYSLEVTCTTLMIVNDDSKQKDTKQLSSSRTALAGQKLYSRYAVKPKQYLLL